jgi:hypothetical protein
MIWEDEQVGWPGKTKENYLVDGNPKISESQKVDQWQKNV